MKKSNRTATKREIAIIEKWLPDAVKVNQDGTAEWFSNHLVIDSPERAGDSTVSWWRTNMRTGAVRFIICRNDPKHDMDFLNVLFDPKRGLVIEKVKAAA